MQGMDSLPGQGTKIPHAAEQLSPWATIKTWCNQTNKLFLNYNHCQGDIVFVQEGDFYLNV